jgi:glycosyltransferase involved in cell wall biosynthesis
VSATPWLICAQVGPGYLHSDSTYVRIGCGADVEPSCVVTGQRRIRILMLSPHATVSGPLPKHTPVLIDALREQGCEVQSMGWGRHQDDDSRAARAWSRLRDVVKVRMALRRIHFDVLVVKTSHEWVSMGRDIPLLLATRRACPRIVLQFHGGRADMLGGRGHLIFKAASKVLFMLCDGVFVLSSEEARATATLRLAGTVRTVFNPFVGHNGSDAVTPASSASAPTLLFVSRLIAEKGVLDTVDAFAIVRAERRCSLVIAGNGPARRDVAERVAALGLNGDVRLLGQISGDALSSAYTAADIFVLPTYWAEGFPTAITEAMSYGLPVVTTRLRGMADHLRDGENALFVRPRDPNALAAAIRRLLGDDELRDHMREANLAKVEDFAPSAAARSYLDALREVAGIPSGS